jgi:ketosteroid isomerase-like protein
MLIPFRIALALTLSAAAPVAAQLSHSMSDQAQVLATVQGLFDALRDEDTAKFDSIVSPGFYSFESGTRFDGKTLMALIKAKHAQGTRYEWSVTEPNVHVDGNTAWITYTNRGRITDSKGSVPQAWLESMVLEKRDGAWTIAFAHSTRVPSQ